MSSDSETSDSDCGVRYKTTTTRHKHSSSRDKPDQRSDYRHSSNRKSDRRYRKSRSRTPDRRRYRRRSRSVESSSRSRTHRRSACSSRNVSPERVEKEEKVLDISISSISSPDDHGAQREERSPTANYGPALPPTVTSRIGEQDESEKASEVIGPALPPHLLARGTDVSTNSEQDKPPRNIGPALPPGLKLPEVSATSDSELSPFSEPEEHSDDGEMIGPLPGTSSTRANVELEQRALEMKIRQMDSAAASANGAGAIPSAREDWMLELPDIRKIADMGLGARQFRTREKLEIGDRSVWTDTPVDRERKKASGGGSERSAKPIDPAVERERERERKLIAKRDKEQEDLVKRHKKKHKRDKTLVEIHQKKLQKEKESKDGSETARRPFDRNVDLQANRFDEAQKKAVLKKAQLLDSRFSSGSSKFL
ncbi:GPALPP motifs-containing protein 1 [Anopheles bellator]|uniref:GPALPP motifs-containing protein 1 n=1 Tax=Anopheles bellator TaxID=139047 RepID=UPI0026495271|nr:GPALPP motifs-containing protein 1 [Anopheles bellator]